MNKLILGGILLLILPLALASDPTSPYENCRVYGNCVSTSPNGTSGGGGNTTIINQYFNDTIWTNDTSYIFIRTGYNQSLEIEDRRISISGIVNSSSNYFLATNPFSRAAYNPLSSAVIFLPRTANELFIGEIIGNKWASESGSISEFIGTEYQIGGLALSNLENNVGNLTSINIRPTLGTNFGGNLSKVSGITIREITGTLSSGGNVSTQIGIEILNLNRSGTDNYAIKTGKGKVQFGDNVTAPNLCYSNGSNCMSSGGNPFNQSLNTSDGVRFKNISIVSSGLTEVPLTIRSNFNASLSSTSFLKIIDNQSITIFDFAGGGGLTLFAPGNGRTMTFSPANGALDMAGSSFNLNRFSTSSNVVIGGTGGSGVSSSLLIGNGVGNTNFGSELGKLFVGVVGNNSRLIVAKGGLGQTRSALSVLNFSDYEVFNVSTRGEVMATNITARRLDLTPVALPTCDANSRGFWVNSSDTRPYYCNTTTWNALY